MTKHQKEVQRERRRQSKVFDLDLKGKARIISVPLDLPQQDQRDGRREDRQRSEDTE